MVKRYPSSKLWRLEEARMHGYNKNLKAALESLSQNSNSNMKQIATINMFEMVCFMLQSIDKSHERVLGPGAVSGAYIT